MKVLLIKDVYKLGRAGDVKKVADGFGRNYLLPQGLAVLATPGAMKQVERIRAKANATREALNTELGGVAAQLTGVVLSFSSKAGETGKLYGSITTQMIADELTKLVGATIDKKVIECQPIRTLGEHKARIRLTIDLNPEIKINVLREGETAQEAKEDKEGKKSAKKSKKSEESPEEPVSSETVETAVDSIEVVETEKKPARKSSAKKAEEKVEEKAEEAIEEKPVEGSEEKAE